MRRAYIRADVLENPEVLDDLRARLLFQKIEPVITERSWKDIYDKQPFLYYRNAYVRFAREAEILEIHHKNPELPYIATQDGEVVSISRHNTGPNSLILNTNSYYYEPKLEPMPVLIGTHQRATYFKLTMNSLLHNIQSSRQKIYIVLSEPDAETRKIVEDLLKTHSNIEAVLSEVNLRYSFSNFGAKFFRLDKFFHLEDDGILPEHTHYHLPYWTSQLQHRSTTAGFTVFRVFEGNWTTAFYKSGFYRNMDGVMPIPHDALWHYSKPTFTQIVPMGGVAMVIDSKTMYKDFQPPNYNRWDSIIYQGASSMCMANIPVYHIGANYAMDYPAYATKKASTGVGQYQAGINLRTGQVKVIDLILDYTAYIALNKEL